uniref:Uncharacterized protein n=1 Tax=Leptocylindrus danicus TaxID=163516 RepID=A0A7S2NRH9_9STRA
MSIAYSQAFTPTGTRIGRFLYGVDCRERQQLRMSNYDGNSDSSNYDESSHGPFGKNKAKGGPRQFLTQRAIQSFMYLLSAHRDPHTVSYLEDFFQTPNLLNYHGTGALNATLFPTWDSVFLHLMDEPKSQISVKARRRGRNRRGFTLGNDHFLDKSNSASADDTRYKPKENPYLKERFVEYKIDIDPMSLASRIMNVREQIAEEFTHDLKLIQIASSMTLEKYHETMRRARDDEMSDRYNVPAELSEYTGATGANKDENPYDGFMTHLVGNADLAVLFRNNNAFHLRSSSPLRRGNFDLLLLLVTQEATHRVLCNLSDDEDQQNQFDYLREFYAERLCYFDGNGGYARHELFLQDLMSAPPKIIQSNRYNVHMVDPLRLAEDILQTRAILADEWKDEVFGDTKIEHNLALNRVFLMKRVLQSDTVVPLYSSEVNTVSNNTNAFQ